MAANLGQAFLGASGIVPALAQELASGSFLENRDSFHDYIYSKLILGDDKGSSSTITNPNPSVFPNTNLASSYPNNIYSHSSNNNNNSVIDADDGSSNNIAESKTLKTISLVKSLNKSGNSKKRLSQMVQNVQQQIGSEDCEDLTKLKKKSHHKKKEKTNVCSVCGRAFAEKYTLNRHMLTHTNVKPYSCSKCNMSFSRTDGLAKHMAAGHRRIDAHHCDICSGTFNSEISFEQHRREYGNTLPFVCNLCMLAFSQCCHLNYHMKSHSLSKLNDSILSESLDSKNSAIDVSELIPDDFSPPKKDSPKNSFTGFLFSPVKSENVHERKQMDTLNPDIVVKPEAVDYHSYQPTSNQITQDSSTQEAHIVSTSFEGLNNFTPVTATSQISHHEAENRHTNQCDNNLQPTSSLPSTSYLPDVTNSESVSSDAASVSESEMKKYLDIKIPTPRFMDNTLFQGTNLSEDGLFRCEICGKGFTRKYHMQRHVKLHIRGPVPKAHLLDWTRRPYACGVCKMGFTRQHHLTRHMLIHTGERPHSCHICGKAFRRFTNLTLHVRTVHGAERPFKCHICSRGFPRLYSLQRHLKLHAKNASDASSISQFYKDLKSVDAVGLESSKSSLYSTFNQDSSHHSPDYSRESISSDQSDDSESFEQDLDVHKERINNIDQSINPATFSERYAIMSDNQEGFNLQSEILTHKDQALNSISRDKLTKTKFTQQQTSPSSNSDIQIQNKFVNSNNDIIMRNKSRHNQTTKEFNSSLPLNSTNLVGENKNLAETDFEHQTAVHYDNSVHFTLVNSMSTQNLRAADVPVNRHFTDVDIRETENYSLDQGVDSDRFVTSVKSVQSPQPLIDLSKQTENRNVISSSISSGTYYQSQVRFAPSPSLITQQSVMNPTAGGSAMSHARRHDSGDYSLTNHINVERNNSDIKGHPIYSSSSSMNTLAFPDNNIKIYHHPSENVRDLDMHPDPSASPMPTRSHNENIQ